MAKLQFKNIQLLAARITSIIPALKADCPSNNEQVILNILKDEAETSEEITETDRLDFILKMEEMEQLSRLPFVDRKQIDEFIRSEQQSCS